MKVIVTEKPSVAKDIAKHVGALQKHEGYFEGGGYQVTWAFGHLITLKEPDEYDPVLKKWTLETLPFIPKQFELKVVDDPGVKKQFGVIKKLIKSSTELICATDAGREGELIFRYIVTMTGCEQKPWKRLWLSSMTDEAIKAALIAMKSGSDYNNLYYAARCRSESDWIVGLNATRNFTVRYGKGKTLWSVGRVQTPVLAMIVNRDDEIRHFKVEPFWELATKYREVIFKHKERFKDKASAETLLSEVKDHPLEIEKVVSKNENEHPPQLFDLTELQREMNRKFGISAADTLQAAQTLYEQKFITYPRTDSRYLTNDLKPQVIETMQNLKQLKAKEIEPLDLAALPFSNRILNDKKVTDHHAIIPTGKIPNHLQFPSEAIYDAIVTRLIAAFYPTCVKKVTTVDALVNKTTFQAKGVITTTPGWTLLYPKKAEKQEDEPQELPPFQKGESGPHAPYLTEGKTKPPATFNENSLLGAMETAGKLVDDEALKEALKDKGIGTPATRASIIETLIKRNYIERNGKALVATDLGRYLIALIQDPNLKSPELTGEWEAQLKQIEKGKLQPSLFMDRIGQFTKQVIDESDIHRVDPSHFGLCPKCKSPIVKGKKGYGCSKWRAGCSFVLWKEHNGTELTEPQIRNLLQKRILLATSGAILYLTDLGHLSEIKSLPEQGNRSAPPKRRYRNSSKKQ